MNQWFINVKYSQLHLGSMQEEADADLRSKQSVSKELQQNLVGKMLDELFESLTFVF